MANLPDKTALENLRVEALQNPVEEKPEVPTAPVEEKPLDAAAQQGAPITSSFADLSEEDLLKEIERRGMKVQKEVLSEDQRKRQEEIEEAEKLKFAIENNLITQDGYFEAKSILAAEGSELTKKEFTKSYKAENPKATAEEIAEAYEDYYFVAKTIKEKSIDDATGDEIEVEKPKWADRYVKLGEKRLTSEAERLKAEASAKLKNIDDSYGNWKTVLNRASEYSKVSEKVLSETNFAEYPTSHTIRGKSINAVVKFAKPDEVKKDVQDYVNNRLAHLILNTDKFNDVAEIKRQADAYLKSKYQSEFDAALWDLGKTEGINEGKVGVNTPITRELISDDTVISDLEKSVQGRLPDNPLLNNQSKR